jgi:hypothetical protein
VTLRANSTRRAPTAVLILLLLVQGCGGGGAESGQAKPPSRPSHGSASAGQTQSRPSLQLLDSVPVVGSNPSEVALSRHDVAYVIASVDGVESVRLFDAKTRRTKTIFSSGAGGQIQGLTAGPPAVAWTYIPKPSEDPTASVSWQLDVFRIGDTAPTKFFVPKRATPLPPVPEMSGHWLAWVVYQSLTTKKSNIYRATVASPATSHIVVRNVATDQLALGAHRLVYNLATRVPSALRYANNLIEVSLPSGVSKKLTTSGTASLPVMNGRWVLWEDSKTHAVVGNRSPSMSQQMIANGVQGFLRAGRGFAAFVTTWAGATSIAVAPTKLGSKALTIPAEHSQMVCVPCGIAVSGREVAWGVSSKSGTTIKVARLSPNG